MVGRIPQSLEHFQGVHHRGEDPTEAVVAVQPLDHEALGARKGTAADETRNERLQRPAAPIEHEEQAVRRERNEKYSRSRSGSVANSSRTVTPLGLAAVTLSVERTNSGTITVRDQYETLRMWNGNHAGRSMISTG